MENEPANTLILTVSATDADQPGTENSFISYHLSNELDTFRIDSSTGDIFTVKVLDFEEGSLYNLTVIARDGSPANRMTGTAYVEVTVVNGNDFAPQFVPSDPQEVFVTEETPPGSTIFTPSVIDRDNNTLNFSLITSLEENRFAVDGETGAVTLLRPLDYEMEVMHFVSIYVEDDGIPSFNATLSLTVNVVDADDNAPELIISFMNVSVPEDAMVGVVLATFNASDRDSGTNSHIAYRIESGNEDSKFIITSSHGLGSVILAGGLDREEVDFYSLTIGVFNPSTLSNETLTNGTLEVYVDDVNEFPPVFSEHHYRFNVSRECRHW